MNLKKILLLAAACPAGLAVMAQSQPVCHFDMSLNDGGQITELVSQRPATVQSQLEAFTVDAPDGQALRFDGYSNYVVATVPSSAFSTQQLTVSVRLAAESYPMMRVEDAEQAATYATVCGNLDETARQGFALELSSKGDLRFRFGSALGTGTVLAINGKTKLPLGCWNQLDATLDYSANVASLYLNGEVVGTARMSRSEMAHGAAPFYIGKGAGELKWGPFHINTFCGLIDDIAVYNDVLAPSAPAVGTVAPDFSYPDARYASATQDGVALWRPQFHGMPTGGWTNETHGMIFSDGRWHVFFQKNANGPYMARLHWGHLSSANLCDWQEEPIALAPGADYDIKGCWSGCVYEDGGNTHILYTAVDNARAVIAQATATDATLTDWQKTGIAIDGRPQGLSDDFRDPFFFTANGQKYVIVGTAKGGIGACTLHRLSNGVWSNDGTIFFQGTSVQQHGTFWEMPNVTPLADGKYLFTCTPLKTAVGVRTLYWVGTIGADGRFTPDQSAPQYLELGGMSKEGYGLLSPTICQQGDQTLLLGIVPDKLPTETNFEMGWAHNYSLPRELSLAADGSLVQKPYAGLQALRTETAYNTELDLLGTQSLAPVSGRQLELLGQFTVASGCCGFRFLKQGDHHASLTYDADHGTLTLDLSSLERKANDAGVYNGLYQVALPRKIHAGEQLKLHVFVDGSIADIFVCDQWAFSVRLFPTNADAVEAEAFSTTSMHATLQAWTLNGQQSTGIRSIAQEQGGVSGNACYDLSGRRVADAPGVRSHRGICIKNGKKMVR